MAKDLLEGVDRSSSAEIIDRVPMAQVVEAECVRWRAFIPLCPISCAFDDGRETARHVQVTSSGGMPKDVWTSEPGRCAGKCAESPLIERNCPGAVCLGAR